MYCDFFLFLEFDMCGMDIGENPLHFPGILLFRFHATVIWHLRAVTGPWDLEGHTGLRNTFIFMLR